jgi:hypothetical protein
MRSSASLPGPIARRVLRNDRDRILAARIERDRIRRQRVQHDREFDCYQLEQAGHPEIASALREHFMEERT